MTRPFAPSALMIGNFVTGTAVLAPTGMLLQLSEEFGISVATAGLLITFGAIVLCLGSPITAWLTSRIDRRVLLTATVAFIAVTHVASALAPSFALLMIARLVMLSVAALYTPQAAGAAALLVEPQARGSTMSHVFLGWSLAAAVGLPVVAYISGHAGWRWAYGGITLVAAISALLLAWRLPRGLIGAPVDLRTWTDLARNPLVVLLLVVTALQMSGQFVLLTFMAPTLNLQTGASAETISLIFAAYGLAGFIGNVIASRVVDSWGGYRTSLVFTFALFLGISFWSLGQGVLIWMVLGAGIWGLGFAASNSMQQVRLAGAAPALASASVSLNTSFLYVGQAVGSAIGAMFFVRQQFSAMGLVAMTLIALAIGLVLVTRRR